MWISEEHTIAEIIEKGIFKAEFFDENFAASLNNIQKYELVEIFEVATLCEERLNPAAYPQHTFNYLSLANIVPDTGELVDFQPVKGKEVKSQCKVFYEDYLLYGRLRPYLNKCYHAEGMVKEGICTGECIVIEPDKSKIIPEYLQAVLLSKFVQEQVNYIQRGSSRPRVHQEDFMTLKIPLMPLNEQQYIAEIHVGMRRLRRRKVIEREELLSLVRDTIEQIISGEMIEEIDLENVMIPIEQEFDNPLPEEYLATKNSQKLMLPLFKTG